MINAHALAQYLGCPLFEHAVTSALIEYCTAQSPPYASFVWAFHEPRSCESMLQLLVDTYCLHATEGHEQDGYPGGYSSLFEPEAFSTFHVRVRQKMVETLQTKGIKELDPKDYQKDVTDENK
jgi:hypothetical protein